MAGCITREKTFGGFMLKMKYMIDEQVVGVIEGNRAIWHVEVEDRHRNKGIGTMLLVEFAKTLKKTLEGQTHVDNAAMRRVFTKAGFTELGISDNVEVAYLQRQ